MICCKIIADYNNAHGHFNDLVDKLSKYGEWLWCDNTLFFSEIASNKLTEKKINNIVKRSGYSKCYIDVYNKNNPPIEENEALAWLMNKLIKINYNECEQASQEVFHNISKGLDILDDDIRQLRETKSAQTQEAELDGKN